MRDKLNSCITDCRKPHGTQHSLVVMLEKWEKRIDTGECVLLIYLSKAFDRISHDLMIAKLKTYGFSAEALKFII